MYVSKQEKKNPVWHCTVQKPYDGYLGIPIRMSCNWAVLQRAVHIFLFCSSLLLPYRTQYCKLMALVCSVACFLSLFHLHSSIKTSYAVKKQTPFCFFSLPKTQWCFIFRLDIKKNHMQSILKWKITQVNTFSFL